MGMGFVLGRKTELARKEPMTKEEINTDKTGTDMPTVGKTVTDEPDAARRAERCARSYP